MDQNAIDPLMVVALGLAAIAALARLRDLRGVRHRIERRLRTIADIGIDQARIDRRVRSL